MSIKTLKTAEGRREAKVSGDKEQIKDLNIAFQRETRKDKKDYYNKQCKGIEENDKKGRTPDLSYQIRHIKRKFKSRIGMLKDHYGNALTQQVEIKRRWKEYIEELYN